MIGFGPFKKHPNKFNYTPRYYDPEKERRQKRGEELLGGSAHAESTTEGGYTPGDYLRRRQSARHARQSEEAGRKSRKRVWTMVVVIAIMAIFMLVLYPRIEALVYGRKAAEAAKVEQREQGEEEFNPYAPITVVPNDYQE